MRSNSGLRVSLFIQTYINRHMNTCLANKPLYASMYAYTYEYTSWERETCGPYTYIHTHTCTGCYTKYIHVWIPVMPTSLFIRTYMHIHMNTCPEYEHRYMHAYIHTYIHTWCRPFYTNIYAYTYEYMSWERVTSTRHM